jgi:hypothetical protein
VCVCVCLCVCVCVCVCVCGVCVCTACASTGASASAGTALCLLAAIACYIYIYMCICCVCVCVFVCVCVRVCVCVCVYENLAGPEFIAVFHQKLLAFLQIPLGDHKDLEEVESLSRVDIPRWGFSTRGTDDEHVVFAGIALWNVMCVCVYVCVCVCVRHLYPSHVNVCKAYRLDAVRVDIGGRVDVMGLAAGVDPVPKQFLRFLRPAVVQLENVWTFGCVDLRAFGGDPMATEGADDLVFGVDCIVGLDLGTAVRRREEAHASVGVVRLLDLQAGPLKFCFAFVSVIELHPELDVVPWIAFLFFDS